MAAGRHVGLAERALRLRVRDLDWQPVEDEVVAIDLERSRYLAVNRAGALLWPDLAEGTTRARLVTRLMEAFSVDENRAESDVEAFISWLEHERLLEA